MNNLMDIGQFGIGQVLVCDNLAVWPLTARQVSAPSYLTLSEALASGKARITETSPGGAVRELLLFNETDLPVLLVDGEELLGVKQNRICNLTVLAGAKSKTVIPVSCSEAGRWHWHSQVVSGSRNVHFAKSRARKADRVSQSLKSSGQADARQGEVWREIDSKFASLGASSSSAAMSDAFDGADDQMRQFVREITLPDDTLGAVFALNGQLAGLELFESPSIFARLAKKLIRSWALDAIDHETQVNPPLPSNETIRQFLSTVSTKPTESFATPGIGKSVRFTGGDLVGGALVNDNRTLHLLAFTSAFATTP